MMKNKILLGCLFLAALLIGCFDDEGNYDYKEINGPVWDFDDANTAVHAFFYEKDSSKATVPMHFEGDSSNFRFEWRTSDGRLFCEERVLAIPTDTVFSRLGITSYTEMPRNGTFAVIDQSTGMKFVVRVILNSYGIYSRGDILILSENDGNAKLSYYSRKTKTVDGVNKTVYSLKENIFDEANPGMTLEGTPRGLYANNDNAISSNMGATTILTSKVAYVINNENMQLAEDLKDEFLDGAPADFNVVSACFRDRLSLLATADGNLYRRVKSTNLLGGKYLSEPYIVDEKGYQVTGFGLGHRPGNKKLLTCWDKKNKRVLMIKMSEPYDIIPLKQLSTAEYPDSLWGMPEGTEVLHVCSRYLDRKIAAGNVKLYSIIYNDKNGKT